MTNQSLFKIFKNQCFNSTPVHDKFMHKPSSNRSKIMIMLAMVKVKKLSISHTRANWQAESSTSYELGWFLVNRQRFPVHSWQVEGPTEIIGVYSAGQWQRGTFLADVLIVHACKTNAFYWTPSLYTLAANKLLFHRARPCGTMNSLAGNHDDAFV